jgi:hypothetical protein
VRFQRVAEQNKHFFTVFNWSIEKWRVNKHKSAKKNRSYHNFRETPFPILYP